MTTLSHALKAIETHPAKITAKEFYGMISENPSVFEHWETPLEITEHVDCRDSPITHLSPHLTFSGRSENGHAANFLRCPIKIATGTFHGFVSFIKTKVEKIEKLKITGTDGFNCAVSFAYCANLKIATGTYPGRVSFANSGIQKIENLEIKKEGDGDYFAYFQNCKKLQTLEGWDLSKPIKIEAEKIEAEKKRRQALKTFHQRTPPNELPFL
jgi:hypothetical protein